MVVYTEACLEYSWISSLNINPLPMFDWVLNTLLLYSLVITRHTIALEPLYTRLDVLTRKMVKNWEHLGFERPTSCTRMLLSCENCWCSKLSSILDFINKSTWFILSKFSSHELFVHWHKIKQWKTGSSVITLFDEE